MKPLLADGVAVPATLTAADFKLRALTVNDVVKDYDAVMSGAEALRARAVFGPDSGWPPAGLTLEQNLIDLGWHQKEFQNRSSFAYTVTDPDERRCLGCVYIYPSEKRGYDAKTLLWVRQDESANDLDRRLFAAVERWLRDDWPFATVAFPGRRIAWDDWRRLDDR